MSIELTSEVPDEHEGVYQIAMELANLLHQEGQVDVAWQLTAEVLLEIYDKGKDAGYYVGIDWQNH